MGTLASWLKQAPAEPRELNLLDAVLTAGQVARIIQMPENTVQAWLKRGKLPEDAFGEAARATNLKRFTIMDTSVFICTALLSSWGMEHDLVRRHTRSLIAAINVHMQYNGDGPEPPEVALIGRQTFMMAHYQATLFGALFKTETPEPIVAIVDVKHLVALLYEAFTRAHELYNPNFPQGRREP